MTDDVALIAAERWTGDLAFLREIPVHERSRWRCSPPLMSYAAAHRWARDVMCADKVIRLSTGETLVRLPEPKAAPWGLS